MPRKRKLLVPLFAILLLTFLSVQPAFASTGAILKSGMTSSAVSSLQKNLKALGFMSISPTGYFGEVTKTAVIKFQKKYNITPDGIAGTQTLGKINTLIGRTSSANSSTVLKSGMTSSAVSALQKSLKALGFMSISPTGYFGEITKTAVIKFQKKYGITPDGIAGARTLAKIDSVSHSPATLSRSSSSSNTAQSIINYAKDFMGVDYVYGGMSSKGFDCSGFTKYVFSEYGITLNRTAASQADQGVAVTKANLRTGDLVFFDTNGGHNYINHVGIYIGSGKFIQASSGYGSVTISSLTEGFYSEAYMTARRVIR